MLTGGSAEAIGAVVAVTYMAHVELVRSLGRTYGFEPVFMWQPLVSNKTQRTAEERTFQSINGYDVGVIARTFDAAGDTLAAMTLPVLSQL